MNANNQKTEGGFTLIEILTVIAIIAILASVVLVSLNSAKEKAKVSHTIQSIQQVELALELFADDVGFIPFGVDCINQCTPENNVLEMNFGYVPMPKWNGPYIAVSDLEHPWGGHIGYRAWTNNDGDALTDVIIFLNDDSFTGTSNANDGQIPDSALLKLDKELDDGNLSTGNFRQNLEGGVPVVGEGIWHVKRLDKFVKTFVPSP